MPLVRRRVTPALHLIEPSNPLDIEEMIMKIITGMTVYQYKATASERFANKFIVVSHAIDEVIAGPYQSLEGANAALEELTQICSKPVSQIREVASGLDASVAFPTADWLMDPFIDGVYYSHGDWLAEKFAKAQKSEIQEALSCVHQDLERLKDGTWEPCRGSIESVQEMVEFVADKLSIDIADILLQED